MHFKKAFSAHYFGPPILPDFLLEIGKQRHKRKRKRNRTNETNEKLMSSQFYANEIAFACFGLFGARENHQNVHDTAIAYDLILVKDAPHNLTQSHAGKERTSRQKS